MKKRILEGPVTYGFSRFEVQETIDGHTRRCAVFDNREDVDLFMAADDMIEALEAVVSVADRKTVEFDKARAAIRKARGEL